MKKKSHPVLFSAPDVSEKQLTAFVLFRLIRIEAELGAIKELITPNISEEKRCEIEKLSLHYYNQSMKAYESEAASYYRACRENPAEN